MLQKLRDLDTLVLGPPKPAGPWFMRLGGLFGWFAAYGALHLAEPDASWFPGVSLVVGLAYIAPYTVKSVRDPASVGRHADIAVPPIWILLGIAPMVFEPNARQAPWVVLYVAMIVVGIVAVTAALLRRRGMPASG